MQFGGTADEAQSQAMYQACRDVGVTFFDTANTYTSGASERFLGRFVTDREAVFIATKAAYTGGAGENNIRAQFDESRRRLRMEYVDALYMHRWDPHTPLENTFETLADLQEMGLVRHIGVSNYAAWQIMKAQTVAAKFGTRIDVIQPMYSLLKRQAEVELLPMAIAEQIAVAAYSPLGGGMLTGKYLRGEAGRLSTDERYAKRYGAAWMAEGAASLAAYAQLLGIDPATLAVAWAAAHPAVTAPIISARNVDQLAPSLAAMTLKLDAEVYTHIASLTPTPPPATDRLEEA